MESTLCMAVLLARPATRHTLDALLRPLGDVRPEAGGLVLEAEGIEIAVDPFDQPFPSGTEGEAFAAGAFGAGSTPQSLQRAVDHPWTWRESRMVAPRHQAFVRLLLTSAGAPIPEMMCLTRAAAALGEADGALCVFTPAGEALRSVEAVQDGLRRIGAVPAPVDLWTNTRLASLGPRWQAMDTVGLGPLGHTDLAALFLPDRCTWRAADAFLRNLCLYVLDGGALAGGDGLPGPDGTEWEVRASPTALLPPERPLLQLAAVGGPDLGVVVKG